jgi:hypothetical protein
MEPRANRSGSCPSSDYSYQRARSIRTTSGSDQRWMTFVRSHTKATVACDFLTVAAAAAATLKVLYVSKVVEHATRRIRHANGTEYPTADRTPRQLREVIPANRPYRFLIRDLASS